MIRALLRAGRGGRAVIRTAARPPREADRRAPRRVWFFDLDNTLHDASHAIFRAIDTRMTDYVEHHLAVSRFEADRLRTHYWRRYGATLLGLVRHHGVDPHHFLRAAHDFDVASMLRGEAQLAQLFRRLPGRKVLLSNAPRDYSRAVLRGLALHRQIRRRYTIESMRVHGSFRPKPSRLMLQAMLAREKVGRGGAVLIEDSARNLKAGRAAGFRTVLMTGHTPAHGHGQRRLTAGQVGLRLRSMHQLARGAGRIRC